ncbi:MAG: diacylglycerol kinase family protein [Acidimicrobiia bacterium]|nr:diacylglycerol kinase family protein [Acidimicrobiia bacterium]
MSKRKRLIGGLLIVVVFFVLTLMWRRRFAAVFRYLLPYVRRQAAVESPALIINRWSGDGKAEQYGLEDHARAMGIRTIMLERGDDLVQLAHGAIDDGADAIGMAGGDGSLGLVAGVAVERDVPFFCVPVGTRNHFALDLGLDREDPLAALDAISDGEELVIDHGTVGDRVFLNNVSFGIYAEAVHKEGYRGEKVKTIAEVFTEGAADPDMRPGLRYSGPDGQEYARTPLVLVSNNPYVLSGPPDFGRRQRLDEGVLGIAAATSLPDPDTVSTITIADLAGYHEWQAPVFIMEADDDLIAVGVDGEALKFPAPLEMTVQPQALRVLVPKGTQPGYLSPSEQVAAQLLDVAHIGGAFALENEE